MQPANAFIITFYLLHSSFIMQPVVVDISTLLKWITLQKPSPKVHFWPILKFQTLTTKRTILLLLYLSNYFYESVNIQYVFIWLYRFFFNRKLGNESVFINPQLDIILKKVPFYAILRQLFQDYQLLTPSVCGDPLMGPRNKFHHPQTCG